MWITKVSCPSNWCVFCLVFLSIKIKPFDILKSHFTSFYTLNWIINFRELWYQAERSYSCSQPRSNEDDPHACTQPTALRLLPTRSTKALALTVVYSPLPRGAILNIHTLQISVSLSDMLTWDDDCWVTTSETSTSKMHENVALELPSRALHNKPHFPAIYLHINIVFYVG